MTRHQMASSDPAEEASTGATLKGGAQTQRFHLLMALIVVALGAALFAVTFRVTLAALYRLAYRADNVVDAIASLPWWMRIAVPTVGGALAGAVSTLRGSHVQGVSNVMEAVALGNVQLSLRTTMARVGSSWTAIAAGLSIGREGPLIEFGGTLGATLARLTGVGLDHTRVLVAAGTAAGFAAAYNTPLAAILFVFETILGVAALEALLPTMTATLIATTLTRAIAGGGPIYGQQPFALGSASELVSYGALGLVAALVAVCFKRVLWFCESVAQRKPLPPPLRAAVGGVLVGSIAVVVPEVAGNGYEPLNLILDQRLALGVVGALLAAKIVATSGSVASGIPGGMFTPVLLVGGALGSLWASLVPVWWVASPATAGSYALVGMAATTAASIHAPLTAAVMVFELSGDYPIVLPLLLSTVVATSIARALGSESVYAAELRRRGLGWDLTLEGRRVVRDRR